MQAQRIFLLLLLILSPILSPQANAFSLGIAPDASTTGPYSVASSEYHFPPSIDPDIRPTQISEIWARAYYPKDTYKLKHAPLIIMLHGQHSVCTNASVLETGICPPGSETIMNHEGYKYLAEHLASWGYWVVSINTNLINGLTNYDSDEDFLARARLVLKHLSLLYQWSTQGNAPASLGLGPQGLIGRIDFTEVGFLGHSNGGEGVRLAYNLYTEPHSAWKEKIPGLSIKGVFEIAGADAPVTYGQSSIPRFVDVIGAPWASVLPLCDGEIGGSSRRSFDRMILNPSETSSIAKMVYQVWGANHDFFNTAWTNADGSDACKNANLIFDPMKPDSPEQQKIAIASASAFFRGNVGKNADSRFNQNFNPLYELPKSVTDITQIDRDFAPSLKPSDIAIIENFDRDTYISTSGQANLANQIQIQHQIFDAYDITKLRGAIITWQKPSANTYFETIWTPPHEGKDLHPFSTLYFRIGRADDPLNQEKTTDFSIALEDASGKLSNQIDVSDYALINGPTLYEHGGETLEEAEKGHYPIILKTVNIPLSAFTGVDLEHIHGVRFIFDKTTSGALYLANIRAYK